MQHHQFELAASRMALAVFLVGSLAVAAPCGAQSVGSEEIRTQNPCAPTGPCDFEARRLWDYDDPVTMRYLSQAGSGAGAKSAAMGICVVTPGANCGDVPKQRIVYQRMHTTSPGGTTSTKPEQPHTRTLPPSQVNVPAQFATAVATNVPDIPLATLGFGWFHADGRTPTRDHRFRTGDHVNVWVEADRGGWVYLVNVDSAGEMVVLEEGSRSAQQRVTSELRFVGRSGVERLYALHSPQPIADVAAYVRRLSPTFAPMRNDQGGVQVAALDMAGQPSRNGVARVGGGSKGVQVVSTTVTQGSGTHTVLGTAMIPEDVLVAFKVRVMVLDLVHIPR